MPSTQSYRDLVLLRDFAPPDLVAPPESEQDVAAILDVHRSWIAVIPERLLGGRGVEPTSTTTSAGVVSLDLRRLGRVLHVDAPRAAEVEAGVFGPH